MGQPRELHEIEELEFDFLEGLMQEPPGGENHGYVKGEGEWIPLGAPDTHDGRALSGPKLAPPRVHGTRYVYSKLRCRCPKCKAWRREYDRARRMHHPK